VFAALPSIHADVVVTVAAQQLPFSGITDPRVRVQFEDVVNYWDLYTNADVLLIPRRFGGQSLPMQEAVACGIPVVTLDVAPQNNMLPDDWLVPAVHTGEVMCKVMVDTYQAAYAQELAQTVTRVIDDIARHSETARRISKQLSWETWLNTYRRALENA